MADDNEGNARAKRDLRDTMRRERRALPDRAERSAAIVAHLIEVPPFVAASRVMAYTAVVGEVDPAAAVSWLRDRGVEVCMPEDDVRPEWPDVIIVPGTAFTRGGDRLGQGGGWYDRFLPGRRADAVTIGIGFATQVVDFVPTAAHDVALDCIVTDDGAFWPHG
jgi:5-formyltetrahydrofolate cyclo-ligase